MASGAVPAPNIAHSHSPLVHDRQYTPPSAQPTTSRFPPTKQGDANTGPGNVIDHAVAACGRPPASRTDKLRPLPLWLVRGCLRGAPAAAASNDSATMRPPVVATTMRRSWRSRTGVAATLPPTGVHETISHSYFVACAAPAAAAPVTLMQWTARS